MPREETSALMISSGQETHKTLGKEDIHHPTTLYKSSYASQMRMLKKHSISNFAAREDQNEDTPGRIRD
jgi:hypothetical protein